MITFIAVCHFFRMYLPERHDERKGAEMAGKLRKSAEDYLEAMLMMKEQHGFIRSVDVSEQLGVTKPSVSYAVKHLRESGHITMDRDGFITLTDAGMSIAADIYDRHKKLTAFFTAIGVDPKVAREDACLVEHDLSPETFNALCRYIESQKFCGENKE